MEQLAVAQLELERIQRKQASSLQQLEALKEQQNECQEAVALLLMQLRERKSEKMQVSVEALEECEEVLDEAEEQSVGRKSVENGYANDESIRKSHYSSRSTPFSMRSRLQTLRASMRGRMPKLLEEVFFAHQDEVEEEESWWHKRRQVVQDVVNSAYFEFLTGLVIAVNLVLIGIEAEMSVQGVNTFWATASELIFLSIYTLELLMRIVAGGRQAFTNSWFLLDFFLVIAGLTTLVVIPLVETQAQEGLENILVVRGLRLLRLARVLRMVKRFQVIWRLVSGLLTAWDTMISTAALIFLWLYIFGIGAVEVIATDQQLIGNEATRPIIEYHFSTLPRATLTLLQFVTMDAIANVYFPLIVQRPILLIYFLPLLMFLSIALMNLVTAVSRTRI